MESFIPDICRAPLSENPTQRRSRIRRTAERIRRKRTRKRTRREEGRERAWEVEKEEKQNIKSCYLLPSILLSDERPIESPRSNKT